VSEVRQQIRASEAWVGNADCHQENWGTIEPMTVENARLAPMYDPAA